LKFDYKSRSSLYGYVMRVGQNATIEQISAPRANTGASDLNFAGFPEPFARDFPAKMLITFKVASLKAHRIKSSLITIRSALS